MSEKGTAQRAGQHSCYPHKPTDEPVKVRRNVMPRGMMSGRKCMYEIRKTATNEMKQEAPDNELEVFENRLKRCKEHYKVKFGSQWINPVDSREQILWKYIHRLDKEDTTPVGEIGPTNPKITKALKSIAEDRILNMRICEKYMKEEELNKRNGGE